MEKYFSSQQKYEQMPKIVYHYCSLETFISIIKNSTIRLSHVTKSNDVEELKYIIPFLKIALKKSIKYYNELEEFEYSLDPEMADRVVDAYFNDDSREVYVCCFSETTELVDQWARYADQSKGVAIGFSTDNLVKLQTLNTNYAFGKIIYDAKYVITELCDIIDEEYQNKKTINALNITTYENVINNIVKTILEYSSLYKNPAFKQEREWRLIYNPFNKIKHIESSYVFNDVLLEANEYCYPQVGFKRRSYEFKAVDDNLNLTSYIDLDFSTIKQYFIKEIIIGNQSKLTPLDSDLQLFLSSYGYTSSFYGTNNSIKLSKSSIPYNKVSHK